MRTMRPYFSVWRKKLWICNNNTELLHGGEFSVSGIRPENITNYTVFLCYIHARRIKKIIKIMSALNIMLLFSSNTNNEVYAVG